MPTDPTGVLGISAATTPATTAPTSLTAADRERARIKKAATDFEAVFVGMMLKQMRKSMTGGTPLFGGSSQAKMYQDMMDDMTAQQMSKNSPFGLAKTLQRSMLARISDSDKDADVDADDAMDTVQSAPPVAPTASTGSPNPVPVDKLMPSSSTTDLPAIPKK